MAVVVQTKRTYPRVSWELLCGDETAALHELEVITAGDWPNISDDLLTDFADVLLGTYENIVTVAYEIKSWVRVLDDNGTQRLRFVVKPAFEHVGLIGRPQPGGPWRRGESRGTRRVDTPNAEPTDQTWRGAVFTVAARFNATAAAAPGVHVRAAAESEVRTHIRSDGVVVVDVPEGAQVLIRTTSRQGAGCLQAAAVGATGAPTGRDPAEPAATKP